MTTLCAHGSRVPCLPPVDDEKSPGPIPDTDDAPRVQVIKNERGDELLITGVSSKFAAEMMCAAT